MSTRRFELEGNFHQYCSDAGDTTTARSTLADIVVKDDSRLGGVVVLGDFFPCLPWYRWWVVVGWGTHVVVFV